MVVAGWWSIRCAAVPERTIAGIVDEWGPAEMRVLGPNCSNPVDRASLRFIAYLGEALGSARQACR
jgi:hypothetical protein